MEILALLVKVISVGTGLVVVAVVALAWLVVHILRRRVKGR
jgi:hypothetical protein